MSKLILLTDNKNNIIYDSGASSILIYDPKNPPMTTAVGSILLSEEEWNALLYMRIPAVLFSALRWGDDEIINTVSQFVTPIEASVLLKELAEYLYFEAKTMSIGKDTHKLSTRKDAWNDIIDHYFLCDIIIRMAIVIIYENTFQKSESRLYPKYGNVITAYKGLYKKVYAECMGNRPASTECGVDWHEQCADNNLFERLYKEDLETYERYFVETTHGVISSNKRSMLADMNTGYAKDIENDVSIKIIKNLLRQYSPKDLDIQIQDKVIRKATENWEKQKAEADRLAKKAKENFEKMGSFSKQLQQLHTYPENLPNGLNFVEFLNNSQKAAEKLERIQSTKNNYKVIHIGASGSTLASSIEDLVIYNGEIPSADGKNGSTFVSREDWNTMQKELNPTAVIISLIYGDEEERENILTLHSEKTLAMSIEKFALVIKDDADNTPDVKSINDRLRVKEKYKVSALLLSYAMALMNGFRYENLLKIKRKINESTSSELRKFISDMTEVIEKSGE